jgi:hypothetical protein
MYLVHKLCLRRENQEKNYSAGSPGGSCMYTYKSIKGVSNQRRVAIM